MIRHVHVRGLGPHDDLALPLDTETRLVGASETGKSTLIEAVCFALTGKTADGGRFPTACIRDGHDALTVELVVGDAAVRRTLDRSGRVVRSIGGDAVGSERRFAAALGLPEPTLLRVVLAPLQWPALAMTNARPLRDLLARLLPPMDPVAAIAERLARDGFALADPAEARLTDKAVGGIRRDLRRQRDEAKGRTATLAERLDALGPAERLPDGADPDVLALHAAWEAHDRAVAAHARAVADREAAAARATAWDGRRAELGEPPDAPDGAAVDRAQRAEGDARRALDQARTAWKALQDRYHQADVRLKELTGAKPGECPTCGAPWEQAKRAQARARGVVEGLDLERQELESRGKRAREAHERAVAALTAAREAALRRQGWDRALRALGPRPRVPAVGAAPVPPEGARPSTEELGPATARGAALQRQRDRDQTAAALASAQARHASLERECLRLDALLAAVREVPSELAAAQIATLGELGPVSLAFGDNPAVRVAIDGRPWWLASRGRRVVADVWLRAALRRALGQDWPLFVDNVQDVAGQPLPEPGGSVVWLRTAEGELRRE